VHQEAVVTNEPVLAASLGEPIVDLLDDEILDRFCIVAFDDEVQ
jgi:hypothetical protein